MQNKLILIWYKLAWAFVLGLCVWVVAPQSNAVHELEMIGGISVRLEFNAQEVAQILSAWYHKHGTNMPAEQRLGDLIMFHDCSPTNASVILWTRPR